MSNVDEWQNIYQELAEIVGIENTLKIYKNFSGTTVSFPIQLIKHDILVQKVKDDYAKGISIYELGHKYNLAQRTIRKYI